MPARDEFWRARPSELTISGKSRGSVFVLEFPAHEQQTRDHGQPESEYPQEECRRKGEAERDAE